MDSALQLLPPHGLDQSIALSVLIGVLCLHVLTETFGWVFVGLVVPGYLASVMCIAPQAGAAVCIEAILTYWVAVLLSNLMSATGVWSKFFGRDRFFLIVLSSVFVRQNCELWLLPATLRWVDRAFGAHLALDSQYSSIGLVLVPLTANVLWKVGLLKSLKQLGIPTAFTFGVLTLLLLPYTNLSYSSLALTFEDVALDFLGSPKAYIILLVTGYLASRFNLLYGWDYNGILVPSLLALTWFEPMRLVTTLADCLLQLVVAKAVLALPGIRTMNLEGPRKTTVVFTLAFLLKYAAGWGLMLPFPQVNVTDLFGFGYILPTLLTVKILQKKTVGRVLLPAVLCSFLGFSLGSLVGFALDLWAPKPPAQAAFSLAESVPVTTRALLRDAYGAAAFAVARTRRDNAGSEPLERTFSQRLRYGALWQELEAWSDQARESVPPGLHERASTLGLALRELSTPLGDRRTYALVEIAEPLSARAGWDVALLRPGARGPVVEVPRPWSEVAATDASVDLCSQIDCRVILWSGVDTQQAGVIFGDATRSDATAFATAHAALSARGVVQLRVAQPGAEAALFVRTEAPDALRQLLDWAGASSVAFRAPPSPPAQWAPLARFALLSVPRARLIERATGHLPDVTESGSVELALGEGYGKPDAQAAPRQLSETEQGHLAERVVPAWLEVALHPGARALAVARLAAGQLGLSVSHIAADRAWLVTDGGRAPGAFAMLVREGEASPITIAAPRPEREQGTWELSLAWWRETRARLLLIGGGPSSAEGMDGEGGAVLPTVLRAAYLGMQRHQAGASDALVLVVRGLAAWHALREDVVVGLRRPLLFTERTPVAVRALFAPGGPLASLAANMRTVNGSADLVGLGAEHEPVARLADTLDGPVAAVLWVAQRVRERYRMRSAREIAASFPLIAGPRAGVDAGAVLAAGLRSPHGPMPAELRAAVAEFADRMQRYSSTRHVHQLRRLRDGARATSGTLTPYYEVSTGVPLLLAEWRAGQNVARVVAFDLPGVERLDVDPGTAAADGQIRAALLKRIPLLVTYGVAETPVSP